MTFTITPPSPAAPSPASHRPIVILHAPVAASTATTNHDLQEHVQNVLELFLSGKSPRTIEAYAADLERFAEFIGVDSADAPRSGSRSVCPSRRFH